jgi:SAM-dependent methyltransferase
MSVFGNYARYYDLLYRDKDYVGEAQFIDRLIQAHAPNAQTILELGCGTGTHAILLAKAGYQLHGVDVSPEMLEKAELRLAELPTELAAKLKFSAGDVRTVRVEGTFDVVISLFHVVSYQTTNADLQAAFATAKQHLKPGGIFIFDIWYGPTVLTDRPTMRVKRLEDDRIQVTRIAEPKIYPNENWVDVNYQVFIRDKASNAVEEVNETHRMRYLFTPEIELFLQEQGMQLLTAREWMSDREASFDTWGVYYIGRA